jgi:nitroreductase
MLTADHFMALVEAAAQAPSADNTQAWEFGRRENAIEVFLERRRLLPTDVNKMFGWIGIGAAVENLVIAAARRGFAAAVELGTSPGTSDQTAVVRLSPGGVDDPLADWLSARVTNRGPYEASPLSAAQTTELTEAVRGLDAGVHWVTDRAGLERMAEMDANSTHIRLEHKPLHDEVFDILRFTRREVESTRYGLDFESLGVPFVLVFLARQLRHWSVNKAVSRLGLGRLVARMLASRLRTAGALCLVTARRRSPVGYIEAGRAMERLWLAATAKGLAVQPHGVLPQYLTKLEVEPEAFLPHHATTLRGHREPFHGLFPGARKEHPAIVLRVGRPLESPSRRSVRLLPEELIHWNARSMLAPHVPARVCAEPVSDRITDLDAAREVKSAREAESNANATRGITTLAAGSPLAACEMAAARVVIPNPAYAHSRTNWGTRGTTSAMTPSTFATPSSVRK